MFLTSNFHAGSHSFCITVLDFIGTARDCV